jgi:hypothetical protein
MHGGLLGGCGSTAQLRVGPFDRGGTAPGGGRRLGGMGTLRDVSEMDDFQILS